jgi:hypothetical protein
MKFLTFKFLNEKYKMKLSGRKKKRKNKLEKTILVSAISIDE